MACPATAVVAVSLATSVRPSPVVTQQRGQAFRLGIMLLSDGAPGSAIELGPYLFNVFEDNPVSKKTIPWATAPLAWASALSTKRSLEQERLLDAVMISESLQDRSLRTQTALLRAALMEEDHIDAKVFYATRYWTPSVEEVFMSEQISGADFTHLIIIPTWPHFSLTTTGSACKRLEKLLDRDGPTLPRKTVVIPSWGAQPTYTQALANRAVEKIRDMSASSIAVVFVAEAVPVKQADLFLGQVNSTAEIVFANILGQMGDSSDVELSYTTSFLPLQTPNVPNRIRLVGPSPVEAAGANNSTEGFVFVPLWLYENRATLLDLVRGHSPEAVARRTRGLTGSPLSLPAGRQNPQGGGRLGAPVRSHEHLWRRR